MKTLLITTAGNSVDFWEREKGTAKIKNVARSLTFGGYRVLVGYPQGKNLLGRDVLGDTSTVLAKEFTYNRILKRGKQYVIDTLKGVLPEEYVNQIDRIDLDVGGYTSRELV